MINRTIIHKSAVIEECDSIYNYADIINLIDKWHTYFDAVGLKKGDKFAISSILTTELVTLLIAGAERGLIFCALHEKILYSKDSNFDPVEQNIKCLFQMDLDTKSYYEPPQWQGDCVYSINDVFKFTPSKKTIYDVKESDIFMEGYTSGSTGRPKKYQHTHLSFMYSANACAKVLYKQNDVVLSGDNLNHAAVIGSKIFPCLIVGATSLYYPYSGPPILNYILERKPNKMAVHYNFLFDKFQKNNLWNDCRLDFIEQATTGGILLKRRDLVDVLHNKGVKTVVDLYGSSELGMISYLKIENNSTPYNNNDLPQLGTLFDHIEIKISENNELLIKSPSLARNVLVDTDSYFNTKDTVVVENDIIYKNGRMDNVVRINDVNVNLTQIENYVVHGFFDIISHAKVIPHNDDGIAIIVDTNDTNNISVISEKIASNPEQFTFGLATIYGVIPGQYDLFDSVLKKTWKYDILDLKPIVAPKRTNVDYSSVHNNLKNHVYLKSKVETNETNVQSEEKA